MKWLRIFMCGVIALAFNALSFSAKADVADKINLSDKRYLQGAVPVKDGKVLFEKKLQVPDMSSGKIFEKAVNWADTYLPDNGYKTHVLQQDDAGMIYMASVESELVFKASTFQLDKAPVSFLLTISVKGDICSVSFGNIKYMYSYTSNNKNEVVLAENIIVDSQALNKAMTKMYPVNGKFRIRTVQMTENLSQQLQIYLNARKAVETRPVTIYAGTPSAKEVKDAEPQKKAMSEKPVSVPASALAAAAKNKESNEKYTFSNDLSGFVKISPEEIEGNAIKMISKEWMLVTAGTTADFNMLTASWGGFGELYNKPVAICFIRPDRYTYNYIENSDTYTFSFYTDDFKEVLKYCGTVSGRDEDKVKGSRLTPLLLPDNGIAFKQARLIIQCKKLVAMPITEDAIKQDKIRSERTKHPLHTMYIGEITGVWVKK